MLLNRNEIPGVPDGGLKCTSHSIYLQVIFSPFTIDLWLTQILTGI